MLNAFSIASGHSHVEDDLAYGFYVLFEVRINKIISTYVLTERLTTSSVSLSAFPHPRPFSQRELATPQLK
jgi:hypothetical protein